MGKSIDVPLSAESTGLRRDIVSALYTSGGGHYGGCLSVVDILLVLYRRVLNVRAGHPLDPGRDRLILSKGHAALALYAVLRRLEFIHEPLGHYASFASPLEGHPDMAITGIDFSTGSLGQGLSVGLGMAYGLRRSAQRVWVVLGDGECQEGQIWEAAMLAASCSLGNLHAIVDCNRFQEYGLRTHSGEEAPQPVTDLIGKWRAFGWQTYECDGHDFQSLENACYSAMATVDRPSIILAHTVKGKGVPLIEEQPQRFHCSAVSESEHASIMKGLQTQ